MEAGEERVDAFSQSLSPFCVATRPGDIILDGDLILDGEWERLRTRKWELFRLNNCAVHCIFHYLKSGPRPKWRQTSRSSDSKIHLNPYSYLGDFLIVSVPLSLAMEDKFIVEWEYTLLSLEPTGKRSQTDQQLHIWINENNTVWAMARTQQPFSWAAGEARIIPEHRFGPLFLDTPDGGGFLAQHLVQVLHDLELMAPFVLLPSKVSASVQSSFRRRSVCWGWSACCGRCAGRPGSLQLLHGIPSAVGRSHSY